MSSEQPITVPQAMRIALDNYKAGQLANAERGCQRVLEIEPGNTEALNLLGAIAIHAKKFEFAVELFTQAVNLQPSNPDYVSNLGHALHSLGRFKEAEQSYRRSLTLRPDHAEAHYSLANALHGLRRLEEAERSYRQAVALKPDYAQAYNNLGSALQELGRLDEAEHGYRQALALKPDYAGAHNNLGNLLNELGNLEEAERSYRHALALNPEFALAHNNLGNVLNELGNLGEAERSYRRALALKPDIAETHSNLGSVLEKLGRLKEAERSFRQALELKPDYAAAFSNLGTTLKVLGRVEEAEWSYRQALALKPDDADALSQWVHQSQHLCAWSELEGRRETLREHVTRRSPGKISPFAFLSLPTTTAIEQRDCARQYAETAYRHFLSRPALCSSIASPDQAKLRIGYLSADYREHATSYLLVEIIERHDRDRFEVFGYSFGRDDGSPMRQRIQTAFDAFRDIGHVTHESAARQILTDAIDILVDLKGYTINNRMQIAALRPAPVQVNWLGYPGTFGIARLADYLIGDAVVTPIEHAAHYSETLALMPHCYQPNDRKRPIGGRPTRTEAGLPVEGFVFCSFNQSLKITPAMFELWCQLLKSVPASVLWLLQPPAAAEANLRREAATRRVDAERIVYAPFQPHDKHLGRLQLADLALDTFPYTSHTTASDALWAGVPVVTLKGETFVSRVAASVLYAAALPELVTEDRDSYYRLALELATQRERLSDIKSKLVANRMVCPLFDSERFTRDLERLYERMWRNYQTGKREHILL